MELDFCKGWILISNVWAILFMKLYLCLANTFTRTIETFRLFCSNINEFAGQVHDQTCPENWPNVVVCNMSLWYQASCSNSNGPIEKDHHNCNRTNVRLALCKPRWIFPWFSKYSRTGMWQGFIFRANRIIRLWGNRVTDLSAWSGG